MNYWHLQMMDGLQSREELTTDQVSQVLAENSIVGTGEWKDKKNDQCKNFKELILVGDIILVRNGKTPIALVEVTERNIPSTIYENEHRVKLLAFYDEVTKSAIGVYDGQPQGTLTRVANEATRTAKFIFDRHSLIVKKENMTSIINLLKYKKQIILQGPPGTGKTKSAMELAEEITGLKQFNQQSNSIDDAIITQIISGIVKMPTVAEKVEYEIINVNAEDRTVSLRRSTGTEEITSFDKIKEFYKDNLWKENVSNNDERRAAAVAKCIAENIADWSKEKYKQQIKIIQFHPSYSYEDFVRGITAKPNQQEGGGVIYEVENKTLAAFAETALKNFKQSTSPDNIEPEFQSVFKQQLEIFIEQVSEAIDRDGFYSIGPDTTAKIVGITSSAFIYSFDKRTEIRYQLLFSDLIKIDGHPQKVKRTLDVRDISVGYLTMIGKHPYYFKVYNLIKSIHLDVPVGKFEKEALKNYILIIDEINRANLSSVLGELIYALEYRSKEVESIYTKGVNSEIVLPPNLYIIGTMNTADRSVGHIDYAIRRRFAFVDVLPKDLSGEKNIVFDKDLFKEVSSLFINNYDEYEADKNIALISADTLSNEFQPKDVWLGHSYFIDKSKEGGSIKVRLQHEILPILKEYIKDGILKESEKVRGVINNLQKRLYV